MNNTPGPGNYDFKQMIGGPKNSYFIKLECRFGSSVRKSLDMKDTPGPGTYNIKPKFNDVPKYLIA